jgi:hypothetical protein
MRLSPYHRAQVLLIAGVCLAYGVFAYASWQFRVPVDPGFGGSILLSTSPIASLVVLAVGLVACVLLATLLAGTIRFDAGLFCATAGMTAISFRGGRIGDVLRVVSSGASPAVFMTLAVELVVLYALVAIAWSGLWMLHKNGLLKADEFRDGIEDTDEPVLMKAAAMAMQICVMALLVLLLVQSDAKAQAVGGVGVAAFFGAIAAYYMYPISPSPWLWVGPMVVGAAGYVLAYFNVPHDDAWRTGRLEFALAPLARPLPIDYATAGPAGAILGYWMSRRWHRQRIEESAAADAARTAPATTVASPATGQEPG